ncbi:MAG: menaquinone biosynthesis protein [Syntrophobacteraceae bacterium]
MGEPSRDKLNLGRIGYLNVLPVYYPLESGIVSHPFTIIPGVPSHLNELAARGALDISPVSSIEYARHADLYYIVPDLSISSFGEVKSVLLFSRVPVERLSGKKILVSSQSHTSVGLLKVLARMRYGMGPVFESGSFSELAAEGRLPDAFLAIGDEALRLRGSGLYPEILDLGAAWYNWTGLPFVFALWVVRKKAIDEKNGRIGPSIDALLASKKWGCSNIEHICVEAARTGLLDIGELREYYRCLRFDLDERERRGLELFYSYLFQIGELERVPRLEIYRPLASVA